MLRHLAGAGSDICLNCIMDLGGIRNHAKGPVTFRDAPCMACGETRKVCSAGEWRWE